jgi:ribonuclease R
LIIKLDSVDGLNNGDKILIEVTKFFGASAQGKLIRKIGFENDIGTDVLSIVLDEGIEPDFSEEVVEYANSKKFAISEKDRNLRRDLTKLNIVTIDPTESKDFDDAFFIEKKGENYHLNVSIADVSSYIEFDSCLDKEARKRTSSLYLTDRVIPMLPFNLSNDLCSLVPNAERFALTCDMEIDKNGQIVNIDVFPSIIKNQRRFTYDEVNHFLDKTDKLEKDTNEIKDMLNLSLELHKVLRAKMRKEGYINLQTNEPYIILDKNNKVIDIKKKVHGTAQEMIEDFMICANVAVTVYAQKKQMPFVFRVHEPPNIDKINYFVLEAKQLSFQITGDINNLKPTDVSN